MRVESTLRKGIALSILAVILGIQSANAQYASSPQARELLSALQDTRSMVKVGINAIEYNRVARDLQIKLDRFLRMPDASKHPAGVKLRSAANSYISAKNSFSSIVGPQSDWINARLSLGFAEICIAKGTFCTSIDELNKFMKTEEQKKQQLIRKGRLEQCRKRLDPYQKDAVCDEFRREGLL